VYINNLEVYTNSITESFSAFFTAISSKLVPTSYYGVYQLLALKISGTISAD
jgi:hypothetical protein